MQGGNTWGLDQGLAVLQSMSEDGQEADVVTYTALLDTCIASLRGAGTGILCCSLSLYDIGPSRYMIHVIHLWVLLTCLVPIHVYTRTHTHTHTHTHTYTYTHTYTHTHTHTHTHRYFGNSGALRNDFNHDEKRGPASQCCKLHLSHHRRQGQQRHKKNQISHCRVHTHRHDVRACRHYMPRFNTLF